MARPLRIYVPGAWYHVTARGNERRDIFRDDGDRERFLAQLGTMVERYRVRLYDYVLMNNHYHLILEPSEGNLSRAMQWLNMSYSQWFNRRHRRSGHLLEGRFKSIVVDAEQWGLELSRYVHLNPIRTGRQGLDKKRREAWRRGVGQAASRSVVQGRIEQLRAYRWSSYPAYLGLAPVPEWLTCEGVLGRLGGPKRERRKTYQRYVEEGAGEGVEPSPWDQLRGQVVLGEEQFLTQIQEVLKGDEREQAGLKQLRPRPRWEGAVRVVEELKGESWEAFRDRRGDWGRDLALWLGRVICGMKLRELAEAVGLGHYGSVATALKYLEQQSLRDRKLVQLMSRAKQRLTNNEM